MAGADSLANQLEFEQAQQAFEAAVRADQPQPLAENFQDCQGMVEAHAGQPMQIEGAQPWTGEMGHRIPGMGSYVEAAQRAMQRPSWPRAQNLQPSGTLEPGHQRPSVKVWQCKGKIGCGYRFNSYSAHKCSICSKAWWCQEEVSHGEQGASRIPSTPPRWHTGVEERTQLMQEVPWQQLAAAGRKGAGKKRARKRLSRSASSVSSQGPPDSTSDDSAPTEVGTFGSKAADLRCTHEAKLHQAWMAASAALGGGDPITSALEEIYRKAVAAPRVAPGHQAMKMQLVKILGLQSQVDAALGNVLVMNEHIAHLESKRSGYSAFILKFKKELGDEYAVYAKMQEDSVQKAADQEGSLAGQTGVTSLQQEADPSQRSRSPSIGRGKRKSGASSTTRFVAAHRGPEVTEQPRDFADKRGDTPGLGIETMERARGLPSVMRVEPFGTGF